MAVDILSQLNKNGSGLNLQGLTASLVAAEITPLQKAEQAKADTANTAISTLGQVRAQFQGLQTALTALASTPILKATSSNSGVAVTVTDPSRIANTTRNIGVVQLAQRQVMEFKGFASADAPIGAGTILVESGAWFTDDAGLRQFAVNPDSHSSTMAVPPGATLAQLAESLSALPGVSARVIDKGDGTVSLGVVSEPGAAQGLRFSVTETAAGLAAFDTTDPAKGAEIQAAKDAVLTVDGIAVFRSRNTIDDLIPGAVLDISAAPGSSATVGFSRDIEVARANLTYLVEQVNATRTKLAEVSTRSVNGSKAGALAGDQVIERLKTEVGRLIAAPLTGFGEAAVSLADLGVATLRDGTLKLQASKFEAAFKADPARFDAVFANRLGSDTAGVEVRGLVGPDAASGTHMFQRDASGRASLDGFRMLGMGLGDGRRQFAVLDGPMSGLIVTVPDGVTEARVNFGRSLVSSLDGLMTRALTGGMIGTREDQLGARITQATAKLADLDTRAAKLEKRYLSRFTAMEAAISSMKSTGAYLTNLVAQWNKSS